MNTVKMNFFLVILSFCILSCSGNKKQKEKNNLDENQTQIINMENQKIDFFLDAQPKHFSEITISGKQFNSKDFIGQNLVVFIYDKGYLKRETDDMSYDMPKELNEIYDTYKDKVSFVGIIEGFVENDKELNDYLNNSHILFEQIDNTISYEKTKNLTYNIFCTPAKILINKDGKVIHSSCGGGENTEFISRLNEI